MPFIFHEQSASKAVGTLHQKPETHAFVSTVDLLIKGCAVDLHISCCPHSCVGHLMKSTISESHYAKPSHLYFEDELQFDCHVKILLQLKSS